MSNAREVPCLRCGHLGPHVEGPGTETHYARLNCGSCGSYIRWLPSPTSKPSDKIEEHRARWRERHGGELLCHWCLARESETRAAFNIDHIQPTERGGPDVFANTRPLCSDCHTIRHALERHNRHARGLSAREPAA